MKLLKSHPILCIANSFVIDSPSPSNLSYLWNYGSLLGTCLVIQIITGVTLAMHYCPSVDYAFISVEHITLLGTLILLPPPRGGGARGEWFTLY
jgi:ubiquinol-cytochrome c reductase cytochrome b subunit